MKQLLQKTHSAKHLGDNKEILHHLCICRRSSYRLALFDETVPSLVKKAVIEEIKIKKERLAKRPEIDLSVFWDNSKMPKQFLPIKFKHLKMPSSFLSADPHT